MTYPPLLIFIFSAKLNRLKSPRIGAVLLAFISAVSPALAQWTGNTSNDFNLGSNWTGGVTPSANASWQVNGPGPQGNRTLNVTAPISFSGTSGKLVLGASSGNMTILGSTITIRSGTTDSILSSGNNTNTIANSIVLSSISANATTSFSSGNNSITSGGALLRINGNITNAAGTANHTLSMGSTSTGFLGNYEISGNIVSANQTNGIILTKRATGTLTLSGDNSLVGLGHAAEGGTIRIVGGTTTVQLAAEGASGWGGMSSNSTAPGTIRVSGGTLRALTGARALRNSILVDGGNFTITGGTRLSFDVASNATFTLSSGNVQIGNSTAPSSSGARFGNDAAGPLTVNAGYAFTGVQTGGNFSLVTSGNNQSSFSLGSNNGTAFHSTYSISGGVLDIRGGNATTSAHLNLGGNATGSYSTFTLSNNGKVVVRTVGNTTVTGVGIQGAVAGAVQNFDMNGGTLVTGHIDATNLRRTGGSAGTFVNGGGTLAPGDEGEAGLTAIIGNLTINSGTFSVDLGGSSAPTAWQNTAAGFYDRINVTGAANLGGLLSLNFIDNFAPTVGNSFTVLTAGSVVGTFSNASSTYTFTAGETDYNFAVSYGQDNVLLTLDSISSVPEPSTFAAFLGLAVLGVASCRRKRV